MSVTFAGDVPRIFVTYSNRFMTLFKVLTAEGIGGDAPPPIDALAPYVAQANWLSVRRADGCLAATGVANIRLNVPEANFGATGSA